ncbi:MAG: hypothetical protein IKB50_01350 [Clostridia bacterium]|nr:hypothetical protein [Clostridia bacterium]
MRRGFEFYFKWFLGIAAMVAVGLCFLYAFGLFDYISTTKYMNKINDNISNVRIKDYLPSVYSQETDFISLDELIKEYEDKGEDYKTSVNVNNTDFLGYKGLEDLNKKEDMDYFEMHFSYKGEPTGSFLFSMAESGNIKPEAVILKDRIIADPESVINRIYHLAICEEDDNPVHLGMMLDEFIMIYNDGLKIASDDDYTTMKLCTLPRGYSRAQYDERDGVIRHEYIMENSSDALWLCATEDPKTGMLTHVYVATRGDYRVHHSYSADKMRITYDVFGSTAYALGFSTDPSEDSNDLHYMERTGSLTKQSSTTKRTATFYAYKSNGYIVDMIKASHDNS